jgi:acyl-CoA synthetase (AMP-forming)/AMP-acid ligase II
VELYPASEGFIAFQDEFPSKGLLLNTNSGIYFEFVPVEYLAEPNPKRLNLSQVEVGVNYALILNTNAGLWGYEIGDTIEFLSLRPFRIRVTGRTKHFISAFGEHVIVKEVENAMMEAAKINEVRVVEFTVAPQVNPPKGGLPYHEWFVEFDSLPNDLTLFAAAIDRVMQEQNIYYQDLIDGRVLQPAVITPIRKGGFIELMRTQGKLGGQNKIPKLGNDRKLASVLELYKLQT